MHRTDLSTSGDHPFSAPRVQQWILCSPLVLSAKSVSACAVKTQTDLRRRLAVDCTPGFPAIAVKEKPRRSGAARGYSYVLAHRVSRAISQATSS